MTTILEVENTSDEGDFTHRHDFRYYELLFSPLNRNRSRKIYMNNDSVGSYVVDIRSCAFYLQYTPFNLQLSLLFS